MHIILLLNPFTILTFNVNVAEKETSTQATSGPKKSLHLVAEILENQPKLVYALSSRGLSQSLPSNSVSTRRPNE